MRAGEGRAPRALLIKRLVTLTAVGVALDEVEHAELRLCRYLAALSPDAAEFVRVLCEQRDNPFAPPSARAAATAILELWERRDKHQDARPRAAGEETHRPAPPERDQPRAG